MWTVPAVSFLEKQLNFWESGFSSLEIEDFHFFPFFWDIDRKLLTRYFLLDVMLACKKESAFYNYIMV